MALIISTLSFFLLLLSSILVAAASAAGYGNVNATPNSKLTPAPYGRSGDHYKGKEQILHTLTIAVQGIVYCKSGTNNKLTPLKGALARITCLGVDKYGYETAPFSMLSYPTDKKGYFFFTSFSLNDQFNDAVKITECKAFLESSPLRTCDFPTDVNKGQTGALLSSYRLVGVEDKKTKLYSVGPFVYASQDSIPSTSQSNGY